MQYGLVALQRGEITPEQFVDLNAKVGGMDIDGNFVAQRTVADPAALEIVYTTGRVNDGSGAANIPEIDNRTGAQRTTPGSIPALHSFTYRARLDKANGGHANQVIWLSRTGGVVPDRSSTRCAQWLRHAASSPRPLATRASWPAACEGDLTCNGTWTLLPHAAPHGGCAVHARRRQVRVEAAGARGLRA